MTMNCVELADVAPELALGVLTGRERADAIEHLDACNSCRQLVSSLSIATDEFLRTVAPSVDPPAGFEQRVLSMIAPGPSRRSNRLASLALAACLALLVAVGVIAHSPERAFAAAEMRTDGGDVVGWVYVNRDDPGIAMKLPGWAEQVEQSGTYGETYSLRVASAAGQSRLLPVALRPDATWWTTDEIAADVTSVALVDSSGRVWCHAELG